MSIVLAAFIFALNAIIIKKIGISSADITFFHLSIGTFLSLIIVLIRKVKISFKKIKPLMFWALLSSLTLFLYNSAINLSSSGRVTLIFFSNPLFSALFGFLFGKSLGKKELVPIALLLAGLTLIFRDGSGFSPLGDSLALLAAASIGLGNHFMEQARKHHPALTLSLTSSFTGLILNLALIHSLPAIPLPSVPLILISGTLLFMASLLYAYGFGFVSALEGSLLSVTEIVWVLILSHFLLSETFSAPFFAGSALIIASVIGFIYLNSKQKINL